MAKTREEKVIEIEGDLAQHQISQTLLKDDVFVAWLDEEWEDARDRAVRAVENHLSNYEKAMAAGILRYWRAKRKTMERVASKEYRQTRLKKLEELNAERSESRSEPKLSDAFGRF